jgi:predicted ATP-binding protein involved in virulence
MLATAADIAHRASTLNPHLGAQAARETPGLVLIDEVDLHLHPRWQRRVVGDLLKAFPLVQFVATTHSPFIIQSLPNEVGVQLVNLDTADATDYANKSVEDIAEDVQGIDHVQRSQRYHDMMETAKQYYTLLKQGRATKSDDLQRLKNELDQLVAPFSNEPAYQAFLELERAAAGLGESSHEAR